MSDYNDSDDSIYPGADDDWYDGVDGDCDGASDFGADGDGYDSAGHSGDDCDDTDRGVNPSQRIARLGGRRLRWTGG